MKARVVATLLILVVTKTCFAITIAMNFSLASKRVLVTGGGRGIGRALTIICAQEGASKVAIFSRTLAELQETASMVDTCGTEFLPVVCDVTKQEQVEASVQQVVAQFGGIDLLVNNVGGSQATKGPFETLDSNDLRRLLELNVVSVHMVTSAVLRYATPQSIVMISSRAGKVGLPNYSFYVASKFALEGLTATLAEELRERGIKVNSLSPGMVDTRSFPKPKGKAGVRTADSVRDGFLTVLESNATGCYLHVDELDAAIAKGLDKTAALKPIREPVFPPE
jgi:3-oxoacyl-[acyl-carrier protein] reductase